MSGVPGFARARSEEQRAARRESILLTARSMLAEGRVADLSLNELARRVGLAKSNVLRYFQSREAVLLELYDREQDEWLDELAVRLVAGSSPSEDSVEFIARVIADSVSDRPVLCELTASAPGVLEYNVSGEVAGAYKRSAMANIDRLSAMVGEAAGLSRDASFGFSAAITIFIGGVWVSSRPSPGMVAAYAADPSLARMSFDLRVVSQLCRAIYYRAPCTMHPSRSCTCPIHVDVTSCRAICFFWQYLSVLPAHVDV